MNNMKIYLLGSYRNLYTENYAYDEASLKKLFLKENSVFYGGEYVKDSIKVDFENHEISIEVECCNIIYIETYSFISIEMI